ncbi:MAG: hypothetical protein KAS63_02490 [Candidatus Heimdallarchaeota archaeon]|nr:hypothetical protein [Candidatus Heimdallarchaeota archaeon]MCK4954205.1 hypothetical protein [Candidatus Heimdallarchaeota archaeon]
MNSQMNTFVKLGSNRNLSKLELSTIFEKNSLENLEFREWKDYLFFVLNKDYQKKFLDNLNKTGSLVKVGSIFFSDDLSNLDKLRESTRRVIERELREKTHRKIKFSLNVQSSSIDDKKRISRIIRHEIRQVAKLRHIEVKIIPTKKDSMELSPFQYYKENLQKRGKEINCLIIKSKIMLGFTTWVTNPFKDIKQDEERLVRLFTHGMSIKLARSLVNISNISPNGTLLDPFCGTGTILIEGLKQGMKVIGVDKDAKCVRASKTNLNHFTSSFPSKMKIKEKWNIHLHDSRYLNNIIKEKIDGIITEPYLGPFLNELPPVNQGTEIMKDLEKLYIQVLKGSKNHLRENGRILFIIPVYRYSSELTISPDSDIICEKTSLELVKESKFFGIKLPIEIGRKHNIINRKLLILEK